MKKEKEKLKDLNDAEKKLREVFKKRGSLRKAAGEAHTSTKTKADESQKMHEGIIKTSKRIDELDKQQDEALKKYLEYKKQYNELNAEFKEKRKHMDSISEKLDKLRKDRQEKERDDQEKILERKKEEVHEKIKRGGKITTDDLLAFQETDLK